LADTAEDRRLHYHRVRQYRGRRCLLRHLQLQPEQGSARTRCLFRSCITKRRPNANAYGHADTYRYRYTDSYPNGHGYCYAFGYAEANAHATRRTHAQGSSYTGAKTVSPR
jgi:hypothetical protein